MKMTVTIKARNLARSNPEVIEELPVAQWIIDAFDVKYGQWRHVELANYDSLWLQGIKNCRTAQIRGEKIENGERDCLVLGILISEIERGATIEFIRDIK